MVILRTLLEIAAILLLTLGAIFLPIVGPLLGLIFVWASVQWTIRQKMIASAIVLLVLFLPIILLLGAGAGSFTINQTVPIPTS